MSNFIDMDLFFTTIFACFAVGALGATLLSIVIAIWDGICSFFDFFNNACEMNENSKKNCMKYHKLKPICTAERFVLFHNTRFRIALSYHEDWCDECQKSRKIWFMNR